MDEQLIAYGQSEAYPFHMPGHKRQTIRPMNPYEIDITEIDGFDNLHHPTGIIQQLQQGWAKLYNCDKAFLLVNGSTCGNEATIFAATREGDTVIVARGCHKSVYHAMELRHLQPEYIMSRIMPEGVAEPVLAEQVEEAVKRNPKASAIIITAPTYEGLYPDVEEIARVAHEAGMSLIVDAAHGAHLGLSEGFPKNPIQEGADAVIVSLHKTLPVCTQVACILWNESSRITPERIQKYIGYFESSSPSYVLMASAAAGLRYMQDQGEKGLTILHQRLNLLREATKSLKNIDIDYLPGWDNKKQVDASKVVIRDTSGSYSGEDIVEWLRKNAKLELEMATPTYALAMTSLMDTPEGLHRLQQALHRLDKAIQSTNHGQKKDYSGLFFRLYEKQPKAVYSLSKAGDMPTRKIKLAEAEGQVAGIYINLYPPGIPVYAPGEQITAEGIQAIEEAYAEGFAVDGITAVKNIEIIDL